jgi:sugar phosphate permease
MSQIDPVDMICPRRWQMIFMLASGTCIAYTLRVNISVAAVNMEESLGWSETQKGLVFSSFYIGYALGQLPSAFVTHWYGAKWLFGVSLLITSMLSIVFPAAIKYSYGLGVILRVLIGLAASATFPSCYYFYKSWVPLSEKTIMIPIVNCGVYLVAFP